MANSNHLTIAEAFRQDGATFHNGWAQDSTGLEHCLLKNVLDAPVYAAYCALGDGHDTRQIRANILDTAGLSYDEVRTKTSRLLGTDLAALKEADEKVRILDVQLQEAQSRIRDLQAFCRMVRSLGDVLVTRLYEIQQ